jgi:Fe-S-cluster containining protein
MPRQAKVTREKIKITKPPVKLNYDCAKCPAYCCSYARIGIEPDEIERIAEHFKISAEEAKLRYTKMREGDRVLRHRKDAIYGTVCTFLDPNTRRCSIYEVRPQVCRDYPEENRCGYYEFLSWERTHQDNEDFIPLEKH